MTSEIAVRCVTLSRRSFLVTAGAVSVGVAFGCSRDDVAASGDAASVAQFSPNAWVSIGGDGFVTILSAAAEMGQGIMTGLPLCLAEDLDADWSKVKVLQSPARPEIYGNPLLRMEMSTHGDYSVQGYYEKLRLIGAQTRKILLANAARIWDVEVAELTTRPGVVVHEPSDRRLGYGEIAARARLPEPLPEVTIADLKPAAQWRLIGKSPPRVDLPSKVDGSAIFGIDVQQPDMLYAAIAYPPVPHETVQTVDDRQALQVAGVMKVVNCGGFVGVIGSSVEATLAGKAALRITWSTTAPARRYDSTAIAREYGEIAADLDRQGVEMESRGDAVAAIAAAQRVVSREYYSDHVAHTAMEPANATARVDGDRVEIWLPTQSPSLVLPACADAAETTQARVTLHSTLIGGAFGRLSDDPDAAREAVLLAKEVPGRAVKLIRSREDEFLTDKFRPLAAQRIDAGLDADGRIVGWRQRVVCPSAWARFKPQLFEMMNGRDIVASLVGVAYEWPNHLVQFVREERGIDVGPWRGIAIGYTGFAVEAMIDDIAELTGRDPAQYRRDLLRNDSRATAVIDAVVSDAQWEQGRADDRGLGLAFSFMSGAYAAGIAEISIDERSGEIRLHEMWVALDAGVIVHPDAVVAQMEGGVVMGLGAALYEQVNVVNGELREMQFGPYKPPRMSQMPDAVHVRLVASDNPPGGVGEIGVSLVAPAIANAAARLTGKRLRHLPMSRERVLSA